MSSVLYLGSTFDSDYGWLPKDICSIDALCGTDFTMMSDTGSMAAEISKALENKDYDLIIGSYATFRNHPPDRLIPSGQFSKTAVIYTGSILEQDKMAFQGMGIDKFVNIYSAKQELEQIFESQNI